MSGIALATILCSTVNSTTTSGSSEAETILKLYSIFTRTSSGRVVTDSRRIAAKDLFFALRGDNFDGNIFAATALSSGAAVAVVDRRFADQRPDEIATDGRYVVVDDTLIALQQLAAHHRQALGIPIIALTGSNGKTTTKELTHRALACGYTVAATRGNLNNHIGVPLTLLNFTTTDQIGIVEMGANHRGEIAALCQIAKPDCGLITNIGRAHLEGFGGGDGVRLGKGELFDYLARSGGVVIYPTDDPTLSAMMAERAGLRSEGFSPADFDLTAADSYDGNTLVVKSLGQTYQTRMVGDYNIRNIASALAIARHFAIEQTKALEAITHYTPDNNRSQVVRHGSNTLYMDAYNANPSSMEAALTNFGALNVGPKVLILGDMRELGDYAHAEHLAVLERLSHIGAIDIVIVVGPNFTRAAASLNHPKTPILCFETAQEVSLFLAAHPVTESHILVKGSRGIALETIFND